MARKRISLCHASARLRDLLTRHRQRRIVRERLLRIASARSIRSGADAESGACAREWDAPMRRSARIASDAPMSRDCTRRRTVIRGMAECSFLSRLVRRRAHAGARTLRASGAATIAGVVANQLWIGINPVGTLASASRRETSGGNVASAGRWRGRRSEPALPAEGLGRGVPGEAVERDRREARHSR